MTSKLANLDGNWYRSGEESQSLLYDVFDPKYVKLAFDQKRVNLGHLIFGADKWKALNGPASEMQLDPLSDMFLKRGKLIPLLV